MVGTIQISSVKQERRPCTVRCGSQGSLLCVKEAGPTRCCEDTSPHGFLLLGVSGSDVPTLWSPSHRQHFPVKSTTALSLLVLPQKHVSVLLEVQQNLFWNIFLKKSAVSLLGQKVFWQIPTPLTSKLERDCPSHCFREQEALGSSCCLCSSFSEEQNGAVVPKEVMNFKRVKQLLGGETQGTED